MTQNNKITEEQLREAVLKEQVKRRLARLNFRDFVEYMAPTFQFSKFNEKLIQLLQDAYDWKENRIIVNMPPRHWKTMLVSQLFPAFVIWNNPEEEFINASYSYKIPTESTKACLDIMKWEKYKNLFPDLRIISEKEHDLKFRHKDRMFWPLKPWSYYWVGIWWSLSWVWFTYWIIDDPTNNRQDAESEIMQANVKNWFTSAFYTRQQLIKKPISRIVIIIVMTRWNTNDLTGYLEEMEREWADRYHKFIFPAIDENNQPLFPERFTTDDYKKIEKQVWVRDFAALYQQDPVKSMGSVFKKEDFRYFYKSDFIKVWWINLNNFIFGIHIDPAFSTNKNSDDTVIMLVWFDKINKNYYVMDIDGWTVAPSIAYQKIFAMADYAISSWFNISYVSMEQVSLNRDQTEFKKNFIAAMRKNNKIFTLIEYLPKEEKKSRIINILEWRFQIQSIYILNKWDSDWNDMFKVLEDELVAFPYMKHDDLPDTLAQAIVQLQKRAWVVDSTYSSESSNYNAFREEKQYFVNPLTWELEYC